jgi:hypothetical protein
MKKEDAQLRHEALIDFLSGIERFQKDGKPVLKKKEEYISPNNAIDLERQDIENAIVVFCDFLNLKKGSGDNIDLYRLLRNYLLDLECREKVNQALDGKF